MALIPTPEGQSIEQQMTTANAAGAPVVVPAAGATALGTTPAPATPAVGADGNTSMDVANAALATRPNSPAPGSFGSKLSQALDKTPLELKPNGKPAPGAWAKSLVGAAQTVLSGLGDVAKPEKGEGGGILSGITGTIANRNARLAQQKKQQQEQQHQNEEDRRASEELDMRRQEHNVNMVQANSRKIIQQRAAHLAGIDDQISQGNKTVKMLEADPAHAAPIAARDITYDDIQKGVIAGKWNLHNYTPFPTGRKVVDEDEYGPQYATTYTMVNAQGKVKPNEDEIKYLNDNHATDSPIQPGQEFDFSQWANLHQTADDVATATAARDKKLTDSKLATADEASKLEKVNFPPVWLKALSQANGDPIRARNMILKDPKALAQFPNVEKDVVDAYPGFDKLEQAQQQAALKAKEKAAEEGQQASGIPMTKEMAANIAALPADKKAVLNSVKDSTLQATLYSLAQNDGSLDLGHIFPNRTYKGSEHMTMDNAVGIVRQLNPNFNEQMYRAMSKEYASLITGKAADAIGQYNNVLQHSAGLADTIQALNVNNGPQFWNTKVNKMKSAGFGDAPAAINAALEPLKGEFELLMSGGYKPSESMQEAYNIILNDGSTPGQIHAALVKIADTGGIRLENIDQNYYRLAGRHVPGLVTPDGLAAAEHIGLNNPKGGDPQSYQRLKTLAGQGGRVVFQSGIPPEQNANTAITSATMPKNLPPLAAGQTRLTDGTNFYDVPTANLPAVQKRHPNLKAAQ